jgi:hypothetical protein
MTVNQGRRLERLCRYITRSGVSEKRLVITTYSKVRYQLKTPYRDGTTGDRRSHAVFEPLDLIARLAALVPKPRVNLMRFHGVFAPNSRHRVTITPSLRNKAKQALPTGQEKTRAQKHQSMTWAQRIIPIRIKFFSLQASLVNTLLSRVLHRLQNQSKRLSRLQQCRRSR